MALISAQISMEMLSMRILIKYVALTKFNMGRLSTVLAFMRKRDLMFSIVFKIAHFQIPVHPESTPYFLFILNMP